MFDAPQFPPVSASDRNSANYHNQLLHKLSTISRQTADNLGFGRALDDGRLLALSTFLASLSDEGCSSGNDPVFKDPRYYAQRLIPAYTLKDGDLAYGVTDDIVTQCIVAINLAELPKNPATSAPTAKGSHLLSAGQQVLVTGIVARTDPEIIFYFFDHAVPDPLDVDLTLNGGTDGNGPPTLSQPSYAYDVRYNGKLLSDPAAPLSPTWARPEGPTLPASKGWARYVDGVLVLRSTDEVPRMVPCVTGS